MVERPAPSEYAPFYAGYITLVPEDDIVAVLEGQCTEIDQLAAAVVPEQETYRYESGKWSIRELFGHLTDAERVFGHRAFCISRGERASLPGFDEKEYVAASTFHRRPLLEITRELSMLRGGNLALFGSLDDDAWKRVGMANDAPVSTRALAFMMAGHFRHHTKILRERYGVTADRGR